MICGKVRYETRVQAVAAIRGLKKDKGLTRSRRQASAVYYCDECQGFHLYTTGKRRRGPKQPAGKLSNRKPRNFIHLVIHKKMPIK